MESISAYRTRNRHMNDHIQPGSTGSVGDVLGAVRLHQSTPDMAMRWDKVFSPENLPERGSNVQDGHQASWQGGYGEARVVERAFPGGRGFKTNRGYVIEDITAADMMVEPFVSSLGDYTWRNKIATTYQALRTGKQFLPLPGGYQPHPGEIARGGNAPQVRAIAGGDEGVGGVGDIQDMTMNPLVSGAYGRREVGHSLGPISRNMYAENNNNHVGYGSLRR